MAEIAQPTLRPRTLAPPRCRRAWSEPVLRRRGAGRREELIHTHSPAPDACPVARLDLRKTGRKQQDSGRRGRRLLAPQPRDGARAGSPEPQARRCPLARTPHYTLRQYRPHAPGGQLPRTSYRWLALARGAPRRGDRSPLVGGGMGCVKTHSTTKKLGVALMPTTWIAQFFVWGVWGHKKKL